MGRRCCVREARLSRKSCLPRLRFTNGEDEFSQRFASVHLRTSCRECGSRWLGLQVQRLELRGRSEGPLS